MSTEAVFTPQNGRFVASQLARGPWDAAAQHGGAPAALLMRAFERLPAPYGLGISRVTYELLRPVPLGALAVHAAVVRPGRRVQLLDGSIATADGVEVVRARALRISAADVEGLAALQPPPELGPEQGAEDPPRSPHRPMFGVDAMEIRFVAGRFHGGDAATAWFRFRRPLVAGEAPTPLQVLAAAGDFGNGISSVLSWDHYLYINPDLTIYIERQPAGEWICLDSSTRIAAEGIGISESILYDRRGRVGRATQALLVAPR
jgi:Thioesterase-like superfamily